jgi:hypothetical protein
MNIETKFIQIVRLCIKYYVRYHMLISIQFKWLDHRAVQDGNLIVLGHSHNFVTVRDRSCHNMEALFRHICVRTDRLQTDLGFPDRFPDAFKADCWVQENEKLHCAVESRIS